MNRASQCRRNTGLPSRRQVELGRSVEPGGSVSPSVRGRCTVVSGANLAADHESNRGGSELEFPVNHSKIRADQKSNRNFLSLWFSRTASLPGRVPEAFAGRGIFSSHSLAQRGLAAHEGPLVNRLPAVAGYRISNRHSCRLETHLNPSASTKLLLLIVTKSGVFGARHAGEANSKAEPIPLPGLSRPASLERWRRPSGSRHSHD
jgi:hypothetical protein